MEEFPSRAVNLHASLLPWNRGADSNFWSFVDGTPKGVTLHYMDEGLDTGDIIAQRELHFDSERETLSSSYGKLQRTLMELFKENWHAVRRGTASRRRQPSGGSYHRTVDRRRLDYLLTQGWDTPVSVLEAYGVDRRN
ncbi:Methionyl-tRNA formyltransferase [Planctomycetes bacterium LzC2]|uniref:Methionyl-tRNA formyltransferase n=1 Tax=Alienimonas chondri TaxID=2681879 RepID=A0ABX1VB51_9PLAN|nr:Methionyl-tRNA formyltransferase [Alienimonas chondri]